MSGSKLITCENLILGYEGRSIASEINFTIEKGDYLCIVGENGAGKTTLMKALLGLHKPISGKIEWHDEMAKQKIGFLPQKKEIQDDFPASVWEIVLSGCQRRSGLRPFYSPGEKNLAKRNIRKVGIGDISKKCFRELSGGQQQRVLLARALCAANEILVLDEPVAGLDPIASSEMYEAVRNANKEDGLTIIMVSHDIGATVKCANKILHIGDSVFFGTTKEYLKSDEGLCFTKEEEKEND